MKTSILMMSLAVAAMTFTSCNKEENETVVDNWNGEIRLSSGVTVQTRANIAPDTQIADEQEVGVFITDAKTSTATSTNLQYTADGNGGLTLATTTPAQAQPYYPADGGGVNIYAYHPYNASAATPATAYDFEVKTNQSGNANKDYYASDLLYSVSKKYDRSKDALSLTFSHKLSKVVCTLKAGAGVSTIAGATVKIVGAKIKGTFKPSDGTFATGTGATSDITTNSAITSGSYIAILPPQTFAKDAKFLEVTLAGGGTYYYKIPNSGNALTLATGTVYKYEITVNQSGLTISSSIDEWEGVSSAPTTGTAEM